MMIPATVLHCPPWVSRLVTINGIKHAVCMRPLLSRRTCKGTGHACRVGIWAHAESGSRFAQGTQAQRQPPRLAHAHLDSSLFPEDNTGLPSQGAIEVKPLKHRAWSPAGMCIGYRVGGSDEAAERGKVKKRLSLLSNTTLVPGKGSGWPAAPLLGATGLPVGAARHAGPGRGQAVCRQRAGAGSAPSQRVSTKRLAEGSRGPLVRGWPAGCGPVPTHAITCQVAQSQAPLHRVEFRT